NGMKQKLEQLKSKRNELVSRAKVAEAQNKVHDADKSVDVMDPTNELGRFEQEVRRQEALATGKAELSASSLDAQFQSLEDVGELTEVEARLAALKSGGSAGSIAAGWRARPSRGAVPHSRGGASAIPDAIGGRS